MGTGAPHCDGLPLHTPHIAVRVAVLAVGRARRGAHVDSLIVPLAGPAAAVSGEVARARCLAAAAGAKVAPVRHRGRSRSSRGARRRRRPSPAGRPCTQCPAHWPEQRSVVGAVASGHVPHRAAAGAAVRASSSRRPGCSARRRPAHTARRPAPRFGPGAARPLQHALRVLRSRRRAGAGRHAAAVVAAALAAVSRAERHIEPNGRHGPRRARRPRAVLRRVERRGASPASAAGRRPGVGRPATSAEPSRPPLVNWTSSPQPGAAMRHGGGDDPLTEPPASSREPRHGDPIPTDRRRPKATTPGRPGAEHPSSPLEPEPRRRADDRPQAHLLPGRRPPLR